MKVVRKRLFRENNKGTIFEMGGRIEHSRKLVNLVAIAFILFTSVAANAAPVVTDIRVGSLDDVTSILFEFTEDTDAEVFVLGDPYRVVIDLPEVGWRLPPRPLPKNRGVYKNLRYGLYKPGNSRVVLDLNTPAKIQNASILVPNGIYAYRLAIDLVPSTRSDFFVLRKSGPIIVSSKSNNQKLSTRLIREKFPDYENVIPQENPQETIVNKQDLQDTVKRVSLMSNKSTKQVVLKLSQNKVIVTAEDHETGGSAIDEVHCTHSGNDCSIGFNGTLLLEILRHQKTEKIKLLTNSPLSAMLVEQENESSSQTTTLLMPIRI